MNSVAKILFCMIGVITLTLLVKTPIQAEENGFTKASTISLNSDIVGTVAGGDTNYYRFTLNEQGYINITFKHTLVEDGRWVIRTYDAPYSEINGMVSDKYDEEVKGCNIGLSAGTYYLSVEGKWGTKNIGYTINVKFVADTKHETEVNNTLLTSNNISCNTDYRGTILRKWYGLGGNTYVDDEDWYRFEIPQNGVIKAKMLHQMVENGSLKMSIMNKELSFSYELKSGNYDKEVSSCNLGIPAGIYYIKVDGNLSNIEYVININYTISNNWELEPNGSLLKASRLSIGDSISGSLDAYNDDDYFIFNVSTSGYYRLNLSHTSVENAGWKATIYDGERKIIDSLTCSAPYTTASKRFMYLTEGDNYIQVEPNGGRSDVDYSLLVEPDIIPQVSIIKLKSPKKKQLNIKWGKVNNITGYEVEIATNKKFTKNYKKLYVASKKGSYTIKALKRKKNYYVRMRAYVFENGKYYYGAYSSLKKQKAK